MNTESWNQNCTAPTKLMGLGTEHQEKRANQPLCVSQRTHSTYGLSLIKPPTNLKAMQSRGGPAGLRWLSAITESRPWEGKHPEQARLLNLQGTTAAITK